MDFVGDAGEVFVVGWAFSVGRVIVLVRGILVRGGCEGFVGNLAMCELWLRHGHLPPFS